MTITLSNQHGVMSMLQTLAPALRHLADQALTTRSDMPTPLPGSDMLTGTWDHLHERTVPRVRQGDDGSLSLLLRGAWVPVAGISRAPASGTWIAEVVDYDQYGPVITLHILPADALQGVLG